jgi:alpha-L-fucosidase
MHGDELKSLEKSNTVFKSLGGIAAEGLRLKPEDMTWWREAKFGMFIHWGLYSILGRGEWVMHNEKIPAGEYAKLAHKFNPRKFNADEWARSARRAGMQYMVLVARHHDGFALWDSAASHGAFDSVRSAARRDFVKEYVAGCRRANLRVGLYYSPMDWRFPSYFRPKELPEDAALMKAQCHGQVEELMSRYGPIDVLWYDGAWLAHTGTDADAAWLWDPLQLNRRVRQLQPKVVVSPRSGWIGDFQTNEGSHAIDGSIVPFPWEKCLNLNDVAWGFTEKQRMLTVDYIVRMVVNVVTRGGNVLLNVGPDPDGVIPEAHVARLAEIGDWMASHAEAIYHTRPGPLAPVDGVYGSTHRANRVYVHLLCWPESGQLKLPALKNRIRRALVLGGEDVRFTQDEHGISVSVQESAREPIVTVVVLELDGAIASA